MRKIYECTALSGSRFIFNCAGVIGDSPEELAAEFLKLNSEMFFDDQRIDVPAFGYIDFPDVSYNPGGLIRSPAVMVENIAPGAHTVFCRNEFENESWEGTFNFTVTEPVVIELPENADSLVFHGDSDKFHTLAEFFKLLQTAVDNGQVYAIWNPLQMTRQMPLVFGDYAVFLYRGDASSVIWQGVDFSEQYVRQGESNLWVLLKQFEPDARLDYKILTAGGEAILDPLNPLTQEGFYPASVMQMPEYVYPVETIRREDIPHGDLTPNITISSQHLGYDKFYRVYTPPGYETMEDLPVIYATDGTDAINEVYVGMVNVLDNLIADGRIRPIIAVFIDPHDANTGEYVRWRELMPESLDSCPFCDFVVDEIVPLIDADYRTDPSADARAVLGTSLGGPWAAYMGLAYTDIFHLIAIKSFIVNGQDWLLGEYQGSETKPLKIFLHHGIYELTSQAPQLREILEEKGYPLLYVETNEGHSYGNWRGTTDDLLVYFFGAD